MAEQKIDADFKHLVRVANVDLPGNKQIRWSLTHIKGVGINFADAICAAAQISKTNRTGYLSNDEIDRLNTIVLHPEKSAIPVWMFNRKRDYESGENKHIITGNLMFSHENDLKRLKKIKSYRGVRHIHGQPVRGQRTRSNFRRNKGKVVGVVKKKLEPAAEGGKKEAKK